MVEPPAHEKHTNWPVIRAQFPPCKGGWKKKKKNQVYDGDSVN